jgi:hypothetical protein
VALQAEDGAVVVAAVAEGEGRPDCWVTHNSSVPGAPSGGNGNNGPSRGTRTPGGRAQGN